MTKQVIQLPVTLDRYNRKKDRSATIGFTTLYEISNEDMAIIDTFHQNSGHLLFRINSFTNEDVPKEDVETDVSKSQSAQLRDAIWVLYKAKGNDTQDKEKWNVFYRQQMQIVKARILEVVHEIEDK